MYIICFGKEFSEDLFKRFIKLEEDIKISGSEAALLQDGGESRDATLFYQIKMFRC